jgi:kynurenine 3-monooxygenase
LRKPNTDAIADMAVENLVEMSEKTADPRFLFKKQVEHLLGNHFSQFRSRYEMVSFSNIPYTEAVRIGQINDKITEQLMEGKSDVKQIDLQKAKTLIEQYLGTAKL